MPTGLIIQRAREDVQRIIEGSFSVELTLDPGTGPVTIQGLATRHSLVYDPDTGLQQIGENCHCSFYEKTLNDLGITTRNAAGKVSVKNWIVTWADTSGTFSYKIKEPYPDETLGLIKCMLAFYEQT
jgi:hypothetical protein